MKNLVIIGCFVLMLLFSVSLFAQVDTLTILHVNDSHSCLSPLGPREADLSGTQGGIARLASVVGMTDMTDPNVLKLHAGDLFVGDLFFNCFFGVPELQILHSLGFDVMAVGNHEFDLTPETLYGALATAFAEGGFPLLSANIILDDPAVEGLQEFIFPYMTKEFGDLKVGIFGLTTPETLVFSLPDPVGFVEDPEEIIGISGAMVEQLYAEECDVVICLSHMGLANDVMIASYIPGIHVIVSGHSHNLLLEPYVPEGTNTLIVQVGAFYTYVGKMQLTIENGQVDLLNYEAIHLDTSIPEEPTIAGIVNGLIGEIEALYGPLYTAQVTYAAEAFEEVSYELMEPGPKDTPVGNLVTDAMMSVTDTDIAITPGGATAQPLYQGPIVAADVFRMVGYGFNTINGLGYRLATFEITAESLIAGLEFGVHDIENGDEYLIQVSGMSYSYNPNADPWSRIILESVMIGDEPIDFGATYTVTSSEFVAAVLDYLEIGYSNVEILGVSEFEAVVAYVSLADTIYPLIEGRIMCVPQVDADDPVVPPGSKLEGNYPNPFNPATTIKFSIETENQVSLEIYNLKGQKVRTLVNEIRSEGLYSQMWNGKDEYDNNVTSGIYLYKLKAGDFQQTKKMILMK